MNEEEINKMYSDIYEGEDWQPMKDYIKSLQTQLQQKENIRKEIREYIEKCSILGVNEVDSYCMDYDVRDDLLRILDKDITKKSDCNYGKAEKENK